MSKEDAMQAYIALVNASIEKYGKPAAAPAWKRKTHT